MVSIATEEEKDTADIKKRASISETRKFWSVPRRERLPPCGGTVGSALKERREEESYLCYLWYPDAIYDTRFRFEVVNRFRTYCERFVNGRACYSKVIN